MTKLSPNFLESEFFSDETFELLEEKGIPHRWMLNGKLIIKLEELRALINKRHSDYKNTYGIKINSGFRTCEENHKVGGSEFSQHKLGNAADIVVRGVSPDRVAAYAKEVGFSSVGTYKNFTHVDVRETEYSVSWIGKY